MSNRSRVIVSTRGVWLIFLFFLTLYLLTARGKVTVIDGWTRYQVTAAIVELGSVSLPEHLQLGIPGAEPGTLYSYYSLGQSLAGVPLYVTGLTIANLWTGTDPQLVAQLFYSFLNPFMAAGLCAVFFAFCLHLGYSRRTALWLTLGLGLGTIVWQHSKDSFEHPQETLLGLAGVLFAYRGMKEKRYLWVYVSGVLLGAAVLTRESAVLFFAPTLAYVLVKAVRDVPAVPAGGAGRLSAALKQAAASAVVFVVGALPFLLTAGWYNMVRFGSPLRAGHAALGHVTSSVSFLPRGLTGLLVSPGRGLFEYEPFLLLLLVFPASLILFWRRARGLSVLFATILVCYLLFYAQFRNWADGLAWGPRYIFPIIPLAVFPLGEIAEGGLLSRQGSRAICTIKKSFIIFLVGISLLIQFSSVLVDHEIWFHEVAIRNQQGESIGVNSSFKYSPLVRQWQSLGRVLAGEDPVGARGIVFKDPTPEFSRGIDFWWVCRPEMGAGVFWISAAALLAAFAIVFAWLITTWRKPASSSPDENDQG